MGKTTKKPKQRDDTARIIAEKAGVHVDYVRKIRKEQRPAKSEKAQQVLTMLIDYQTGKSQLIKALEELVPMTTNPEKYGR
jgi:hypothetical protein